MLKKMVLSLLVVLILAVSAFAGFAFLARPLTRPPLSVAATSTPERLARGEHLAFTTGCLDCHSKRDFSRYAGPPMPPFGAHGDCFDKGVGVPGVVCPPNLTSDKDTGVGSWTDGEILRAMREGVSKDGRPLFPLMPYDQFAHLSDDDALSIVAFLRTLPAESYQEEAPRLDFPMPIVIRFLPKPLSGPIGTPARTDTRAYGEYLTTIMGCKFCHSTNDDHMTPIPGLEWAGDNEFRGPWGAVRSANLSPHATGLGEKTKENFIGVFRAFGNLPGEQPKDARNTIMPWSIYNKLSDEDLGIVYDYLKMQKPVDHAVEKYPKTPRG